MSARVEFRAIGTTARLVVRSDDPRDAARAEAAARRALDALDRAASRFRDDSELELLHRSPRVPRRVGRVLAHAVRAALWAARATGGAVDPTVGRAVRAAGYDRDLALLRTDAATRRRLPDPAPAAGAWRGVVLDRRAGTLLVPDGTDLDLGATAKALAADHIARRVRTETGADVLVDLGGDIAVVGAGAPWPVGIADDHRATRADAVVDVAGGGIATSSTTVRRWRTADGERHHIIDPATGAPADSPWRTATVAARSCVAANAASTAAIVLGGRAPRWLEERGLPARLVTHDGAVVRVGGWPE